MKNHIKRVPTRSKTLTPVTIETMTSKNRISFKQIIEQRIIP